MTPFCVVAFLLPCLHQLSHSSVVFNRLQFPERGFRMRGKGSGLSGTFTRTVALPEQAGVSTDARTLGGLTLAQLRVH